MLSIWFFVVLIFIIGYLLYITRPREETLLMMSRERIRKIQFWFRSIKG